MANYNLMGKEQDYKENGKYIPTQILKPGQNKKGQKNFQLHRFLNTFSQLLAVKKYSKNGAAGKIFGPSYFDPALGIFYDLS